MYKIIILGAIFINVLVRTSSYYFKGGDTLMFLVLVTCLEYLDSIVNLNSIQFRRHPFPIYLTTIRLRDIFRNLSRGVKNLSSPLI